MEHWQCRVLNSRQDTGCCMGRLWHAMTAESAGPGLEGERSSLGCVWLEARICSYPAVWAARDVEHFWGEGPKQLRPPQVMYPAQERLLCPAEEVCQIISGYSNWEGCRKGGEMLYKELAQIPTGRVSAHRDFKVFLALIWNVYLG